MSRYKPRTHDGYFAKRDVDYNALDWKKDDQHLGMITGRSADWIRNMRKKLGKRKPEKKTQQWGKTVGIA